MAETDQNQLAMEGAVRNKFLAQMETVEKRYLVDVSKSTTKRNLLIGGTAAAAILAIAPLAILTATAAVSLTVALFATMALASGGYYAKIRLPLWIKQGQDHTRLELLKQANRHKESIQKEMNRALSALKVQTRENPIEQLQNYLIEKGNRLMAFKSAVSQIGGQVKTMGDMLTERKTGKPNGDYSKKQAALSAMTSAYEGLKLKVKQGDAAIIELRDVIEDQKFDWKFAQAGKFAMENLHAMKGQDLLNEVLAGESFDEVRGNFNRVFSDIEVEIHNFQSGKSPTYGEGSDGLTLDMTAIHLDRPKDLNQKKEA